MCGSILLRSLWLLGLVGGLLPPGGRLPAQEEPLEYVEEPEEVDDASTYHGRGTLEAVELSSVSNTTGRPHPLLWIAPEGKIVEKGTLVAELDPGTIDGDLEPARSRLETATARLAAAESCLQAAKEGSAASVDVAERALVLATEARERLDRDETALEVRAVEGELAVAEKRLEVALRRAERLRKLPTSVEIEERIEEAEIAVLEAKTRIELARARRELLTGSVGRYKAVERELEAAQRRLEVLRARTEGAAAVREAEVEVVAARAAREEDARKLARLEEALAACRIVAPVAGRLVSVNTAPRGGLRRPLPTNRVLYDIVDPHRHRLELLEPLEVAQRLSTGQEVAVSVDAFPDASFSGRIASIGVERGPSALSALRRPPGTVRATRGSRATAMARIEIHIDDPEGRLRPGMTAEVTLELAEDAER